jgi:hypothetical protein
MYVECCWCRLPLMQKERGVIGIKEDNTQFSLIFRSYCAGRKILYYLVEEISAVLIVKVVLLSRRKASEEFLKTIQTSRFSLFFFFEDGIFIKIFCIKRLRQ